jgi:hypothetical protein
MNKTGRLSVFVLQEEGVKSEVFVYIILIIFLLMFGGCGIHVNKNVAVADGTSSSGYSSVNGNIKIGVQCNISGGCKTVNGNIVIGENTRVGDLQTVNGYVKLYREVKVDGDAETINGYIRCAQGVEVEGTLSTINGNITCSGTEISRDIKTCNGNIDLDKNSTVSGSVIIMGTSSTEPVKTIYIRLSGQSVIKGDILVKDSNRKVKVVLSDSSMVEGKVFDAELVKKQ